MNRRLKIFLCVFSLLVAIAQLILLLLMDLSGAKLILGIMGITATLLTATATYLALKNDLRESTEKTI